MVDFDLKEMVHYASESFGVPLPAFKQALVEEIDHVATGKIEEEEFWAKIATKNCVSLPSNWKQNYIGFIKKLVQPREPMFSLVKELKAKGYQVALLSDVTKWQAEAFAELGLYEDFSPLMLSCNMNTRKPHHEAYQHALAKIGYSADQCIFIDDRPENIESAQKAGMQGILYTSFEDVKRELNKLLMRSQGDQNEKK